MLELRPTCEHCAQAFRALAQAIIDIAAEQR